MNKEIFNNQFKHSPYIPYDPSVNPLYTGYTTHPTLGGVQPFVYTDWRDEMMAAHDNCYIHAGLNPAFTCSLKGPDAHRFLNENLVNGFKTFAIGKSRHGLMVNEDGLIMSDGLLIRVSEDEYLTYWLSPYIEYKATTGNYDIEVTDLTGDAFMFQLGGPRSLEIVEAATGVNFHDLEFGGHRMSKINGLDIRVLRIGMAGSLAYEIHGEFKDSIPVYNAIVEAGTPYGIRKLGRHAYWNTHTEAGFPQFIIHFPYAWEKDPEFMKWMADNNIPMAYYSLSLQARNGSMGTDLDPRYVNPFEMGWGKSINFNHDFVGKEALLKLKESHREMVTLVWNSEDILDIFRSEFEQGEPYATLEGPEDYLQNGQFEYRADKVLVGNKLVGVSTGRIHSWHYRETISLATMEPEFSAIGTEVVVLWGDPGTRQKEIRAKVARFPYFDVDRNETLDVSSIPSGIKK